MEEKMTGWIYNFDNLMQQLEEKLPKLTEKYGDILDEELNKSAGSDAFDKEKNDNTAEPQA